MLTAKAGFMVQRQELQTTPVCLPVCLAHHAFHTSAPLPQQAIGYGAARVDPIPRVTRLHPGCSVEPDLATAASSQTVPLDIGGNAPKQGRENLHDLPQEAMQSRSEARKAYVDRKGAPRRAYVCLHASKQWVKRQSESSAALPTRLPPAGPNGGGRHSPVRPV